MFKRIQRSLLYASFLFSLIICELGAAFELNSASILNKKDYFSKLKRTEKYEPLAEFIDTCVTKQKLCYEEAPLFYSAPKWSAFQNLIAGLAIDAAVSNKESIEKLLFLDRSELRERHLRSLIKHYSQKDLKVFFTEDFFLRDQHLDSLVLKEPHLLCSLNFNRAYVEKSLIRISEQKGFYGLSFSNYPCDLPLKGEYLILKEEIASAKRFELKSYKFSFLEREVSSYYLKKFKYHKKGVKKLRAKKTWKKLIFYPDYVQHRIISNLFYSNYYEILTEVLNVLSKEEQKKISPYVLQYLTKSAAALGNYDLLLSMSEGLSYEPSKWSEEVLLMRAAAFLRKNELQKAAETLDLLLKNVENLELSALYWKWVVCDKMGKKTKKEEVARQILNSYPFSYYGILVASRSSKTFFNKYKNWLYLSSSFTQILTKEERERLSFYYAYGYKIFFAKTYNSIKEKLNEKQRALFSLVFANQEKQIEVIRVLNTTWDKYPKSRKEPFVTKSFPKKFKKEIRGALKNLKWMKLENVWAVIRQESAFNISAKSAAGARGLMQIIPATGREVARQLRIKNYRGAKSLFNAKTNISIGAKYMDRLTSASRGYLPYAYASYNVGPGRMYHWSKRRLDIQALRQAFLKTAYDPIDELWVEELPWSETRFYVKALLRNQGIYKALLYREKAFACYPFWRCETN